MGLIESLWGMGFVPQPNLPLLERKVDIGDTSRAALLADNSGQESSAFKQEIFISDFSVGENCTPVATVRESSANYPGVSHICSNQGCSNESGTLQNSVGQISIFQVSLGKSYLTQIGGFEASIGKENKIQLGIAQISPPQNGVNHDGVIEVRFPQVSIAQVSPTQVSLTEVTLPQANPFQISSFHVSLSEIDTTQTQSAQISISKLGSFEISLSSSITLQQLLSSHNFSLQNTTVPTWLEFLQGTTPFNLNIEIADLPTGQLAEATITGFDPTGRPNSGTLYLDIDANGLGWYIDPTPWDNSEYSQALTDTAYRATSDSAAYGHYDLFTTILHETAHLQGFISGYNNYDRHIQTQNGSKTFVGDSFSAILTPDGSHLSSQVYPYDLMNTTLTPGVRKLPSALDIQILNTLRQPTSLTTQPALLTAPLSAGALIAINNGSFDTNTDWYTRGDSQILNGQAVLSEDSPYLSHLSQTFVIPQGAKALQFTLVNTNLHSSNSSLAPGDAFVGGACA
jgi:hypothetical protein